jgi:hypothetical protein
MRPRRTAAPSFVIVNGPEGASYDYMEEYMDEIERRLMPLRGKRRGDPAAGADPAQFSATIENFNTGIVIFVLETGAAAVGLGDHGGSPRQAVGPARGAGLSGDAPGLRRLHPKTGSVRHRRRHLPGTRPMARHPSGKN